MWFFISVHHYNKIGKANQYANKIKNTEVSCTDNPDTIPMSNATYYISRNVLKLLHNKLVRVCHCGWVIILI